MYQHFFTLSNFLSIFRIISAPLIAFLIIFDQSNLYLAIVLFTVASLTDFFDGYFARKYNNATTLGAFLDPFADKALILITLFSFYLIGTIKLWVILLIFLRDFIVTILRTIAIQQGTPLKTTKIAKSKTTLQFIFIYFLFSVVWHKLEGRWFFTTHTCRIDACGSMQAITQRHHLSRLMMYGIVGFTLLTGVIYLITNRHVITTWIRSK